MRVAVAPILLGLTGLAHAQAQTGNGPANDPAKAKAKPNFIFIITDDQDLRLGSLEYQPLVQKHLVDQGTTFSKHYSAHNTNVTDVALPYGGYPKFATEGWNDKYLPVWLQDAGYNTYYTGKLMNGHSTQTYNNPFPNGWTGTDFFLDPNTYVYYNVSMQRNKEEPRTLTGQYSTDLAASTAISFLDEALADASSGNSASPQKPFFIGVAPIGPHSETWQRRFTAPVPADRHKDLFPGLKVPRNPNFNPEVPSGGGWIKTLDRQNQTVLDYHDDFYRKRIQSLQAVDELVDGIVKRLEAGPPDVLANTYLIYTSDNGFHVGQHRLAPGKTCSIEEDINVPFVIRGPGIPAGSKWELPTSHTDIVPTLFELAGIPLQDGFDGVPMPVTETAQQRQGEGADAVPKGEHVNVEFWGDAIAEGDYPGTGSGLSGMSGVNGTYKALRLLGDGYDLSYTVWCTNEHELYDLKADPWQMHNIYPPSPSTSPDPTPAVNGWDKPKLLARVDALLLTLKACRGAVCRRPWVALHPAGDVHSLRDAMAPRFDDFYLRQQPRVAFSECKLGYLAEFEGPMRPSVFGGAEGEGMGMLARWEDYV